MKYIAYLFVALAISIDAQAAGGMAGAHWDADDQGDLGGSGGPGLLYIGVAYIISVFIQNVVQKKMELEQDRTDILVYAIGWTIPVGVVLLIFSIPFFD